jgi:chromatin modification-related protein YNG2
LLAQRLIDLITRTRARLDADIIKVKHLQGEVPEPISALGKAGSAIVFNVDFGPSGRNPAQQISESLRNALANPSESRQGSATPTPSAAAATSGVSVTKSEILFYITFRLTNIFSERRINNPASIKITPVPSPTKHRSASPSAAVISQTTHARSRLRQVVPVEESEPEAGGDDEMDVEDDAEDERLYCFCQKQSYGDVSECPLLLL